ncbi:hypothetical protein LQE92_11865 [Lacrimispora sp. NSJ-141]|uniref:Uncharacterized protein n=1 Tax=Lientehia hominis TaxID=2897778 RepID=A0AAP2RKG2_9FIRM|nr:hypothetical protein [Lientehia hominis]MCD2493310.1 hypothetical protein [Lientehia hominis]
MVSENEDGSYTILINARLSDAGRLRAYEHAMKHISDNDFQKEDVQTIEAAAHEIPRAASSVLAVPSVKSLHGNKINKLFRNRKKNKTRWKDVERRRKWLNAHHPDCLPGYDEILENPMTMGNDF